MPQPHFTPDQFRQAQIDLGLSDRAMAAMLGFLKEDGSPNAQYVRRHKVRDPHAASYRGELKGAAARLLQAYLDGFRPADWPE